MTGIDHEACQGLFNLQLTEEDSNPAEHDRDVKTQKCVVQPADVTLTAPLHTKENAQRLDLLANLPEFANKDVQANVLGTKNESGTSKTETAPCGVLKKCKMIKKFK